MLKKILFITIILLNLLGLFDVPIRAESSPHPSAWPVSSHGELDLTGWDFTENGAIKLSGEWELYWQQLLEPQDFANQSKPVPSFVEVPGIWSDYQWDGSELANQSFATYRLVVLFNKDSATEPKWLYMPSVATAYKLWINGEMAAENGMVGASKDQMIPHNVAKVIPIRSADSHLELVIQVSNFVQRKGGLWEGISLGYTDQIVRQREFNNTKTLGFFIGLFVMGIYHFFLYFPYRFDRAPLFFGLLCFAVGIRALFVGDILAVHWIPHLPWEWAVKIEYLSVNFAMVFLLLFVSRQFPLDTHLKMRNVLLILEGLFIAFVTVSPALYYTQALWVEELLIVLYLAFMFYVFIAALWRSREGSLINLLGLMFVIITVMNDIFLYKRWLDSIDLSPLGLFAYLFAQSIIMSHKFARSFTKVEQLSSELQQANLTLEQKIDERTSALRRANESLREVNNRLGQMEDSRRRLLSNITHEMGNPLTSLQSYLHAVEDGILRGEDTLKYFGRVRDKIRYLDQMIQDLVELSRLETMQILFQFQSYTFHSFIRQLYEKYEWDVTRKGIRFIFEQKTSPQIINTKVWIDPLRIEQVFVNLLFNAIKYTPAGRTISICCEMGGDHFDRKGNYATFIIRDTGQGIAPEDLPHVFERYYKGNSQQIKEEGGGLGLSISREIVEKHGGTINVESILGEGSTFYVHLPVHTVSNADVS